MREDEQVDAPHPRARVRRRCSTRTAAVRLARVQPLPGGAPPGRARRLLRRRRPVRARRSTRVDHRLSLGADDAAAPARARRAAGAALPRPQDPRARALPLLSRSPDGMPATDADSGASDDAPLPASRPRSSAAHAVRGGPGEPRRGADVERPKRDGHGDYSTNAAMLLAPVLRRAAARDRRADRRRARSRALGDDLEPLGGRGARLPEPVHADAWLRAGAAVASWTPATRFGAGGADPRRADPRRVRHGQPDRPAGRRQRPPRRLRRRACADPRAPWARRVARVLLQRRRRPDPPARRVGPGPRAG